MSNNYELLLQENNELKLKISKIELELEETKEHLKHARTAYLNKKVKLQKIKEINTLGII